MKRIGFNDKISDDLTFAKSTFEKRLGKRLSNTQFLHILIQFTKNNNYELKPKSRAKRKCIIEW